MVVEGSKVEWDLEPDKYLLMSAVTEEEERQTAELESEQEVGVGGTTS